QMAAGDHVLEVELVKQLALLAIPPPHHGRLRRCPPISRNQRSRCRSRGFSTWSNSGSHTKVLGISSPGTIRPTTGPLGMESNDGLLCRAGRLIEEDVDLCDRQDRQSYVRRRCRLAARGNCALSQVEGPRCSAHRDRDGTNLDLADHGTED